MWEMFSAIKKGITFVSVTNADIIICISMLVKQLVVSKHVQVVYVYVYVFILQITSSPILNIEIRLDSVALSHSYKPYVYLFSPALAIWNN